jgi:transposase
MVALLLYAYALGERSSRAIERRCREDVAFRVICANRSPTTPPSPASAPATSGP